MTAKSTMPRAFIVPNGNVYPISSYLRAWRMVIAADPDTETRGWNWYPTSARDIRRDFYRGVEERINLRGNLRMNYRGNYDRIMAKRRATVKCSCNWCGQSLPHYAPAHARFCDASCRRSYS